MRLAVYMDPKKTELPPIDREVCDETIEDLSRYLYKKDTYYGQMYSKALRDTLVTLEKQEFEIPPRLIRFISESWESQQPTRLDTFLADHEIFDDIDSKLMVCINYITQLMIIICDKTRGEEEVLAALQNFESSLNNLPPYYTRALLSACWPSVEQGLDKRDNFI